MGVLNAVFTEMDAPLASEEDLNDSSMNRFIGVSRTSCDEDVDVKTGLLKNLQLESDWSVITKRRNQTDQHAQKQNIVLINGNVNKEPIQEKRSYRTEKLGIEVSKVGAVNIKLYWKYVRAGATFFGIGVFIISTLISHGLFRFADSWLGVWTNNERLIEMHQLTSYFNASREDKNSSYDGDLNPEIQKFNSINYYYLIVYCSSVLGIIVFTYIMIYRFFIMCISASKNLHNQMFNR